MIDHNEKFYGHCGSGTMYGHMGSSRNIYTEGVKDVADTLGAYWLIDLIFFNQKKAKGETFQLWTLTATNSKGKLELSDGNENVLWTKNIPYTSMPDGRLKLYHITDIGEDMHRCTVLLPSEY